MKKIYTLLFLICISSFTAHAQVVPIITQSNYPTVGDSYFGKIDFSVTWAPGANGINQTWDFSGLNSPSNSTFTYSAPISTPYNTTFASSDIALIASGQYSFFLSSSSEFYISGTVTNFGTPVVRPYSNPQKIITFPFTYLNNLKDTAQTPDYNVSAGNHERRIIYSETKADAYGSIIVPGPVTYNNVTRLEIATKIIDSIFNSSNVFQTENISIDTNYYWISSDYKPHVFTLSKSIQNGGAPTIFAQYFTNPAWPTGTIDAFNNSNISVYPNPVASDLIVEIDQAILNGNPDISFCLTNSTGYEVVACKKISSEKVNISRENLSSGIYFYKIVSEGEILRSGKITIQ